MKARFKLSVLAVLALLAGCKGEDAVEEPVDFTQATYTLYNGGQVSVGLAVVNPVSQNLTIPLEIEGPASDVTIIPQERDFRRDRHYGQIPYRRSTADPFR